MSNTEALELIESHPDIANYNANDSIDIIDYYRGMIGAKTSELLTDSDIKYFLAHAKACNLNPLKQEIVILPFRMKDGTIKVSYITTIGGLRIIAQRTGLYRGQTTPIFYDNKQNEYEAYPYTTPLACKVGVYRADCAQPIYYVAKFSEYVQDKSPNWATKPCTMLQKCAEAGAIRKAFPETATLYVEEEMTVYEPQINNTKKPTKTEQVRDLSELIKEATELAATKSLCVNTYKDLTQDEAFTRLCEKINAADEKTLQHIIQGLDKLQPLEQTENRESENTNTNTNNTE